MKQSLASEKKSSRTSQKRMGKPAKKHYASGLIRPGNISDAWTVHDFGATEFRKPEEEPVQAEKKAMEIFDKMKSLGFHVCGKGFVCSCCGEYREAKQGIRCDVQELYLCNSCRAGQGAYERKSKSLRAITIPMGNKR